MYTLFVRRMSSAMNYSRLRNVGIIAHIDAGKTTTTERILYYAGKTDFIGDVDKGDTVTDYLDLERERGISIMSAAATLKWNGHEINLIDTPGHVDFTMEVERALCVLDGAICILDAIKGVQAQTVTVWRQAVRHSVPRILYVNKLDRLHSSASASSAIDRCVKETAERLAGSTKALPIHLPLYADEQQQKTGNVNLCGLIDMTDLSIKLWNLKKDADGKLVGSLPLTSEHPLYEEAVFRRGELIETAAEFHEPIGEEYLRLSDPNIHVSPGVLREGLRKATISGKVSPLLCGSSRRNIGVQPLLDGILSYLPHPSERPALLHFLERHPTDQLCAFVFKVVHDRQRGALSFVRLYAGHIKVGDTVHRLAGRRELSASNKGCPDAEHGSLRVQRILRLVGDHYEECSCASPGSIVAIPGWSTTYTGDLLLSTNPNDYLSLWKDESKQWRDNEDENGEEQIEVNNNNANPEASSTGHFLLRTLTGGHSLQLFTPVVFASVEAGSLAGIKPMEHALDCLQREDPSIHVRLDEDSGQTIISAMGDLHLEVSLERLRRQYRVDISLGKMRINYCEHLYRPRHISEKNKNRDTTVSDDHFIHTVQVLDNKRRYPILVEISLQSLSQPSQDNQITLKNHIDFMWHQVSPHLQHALRDGLQGGLRSGPLLRSPVLGCHVIVHRLAMISIAEDGTFSRFDSSGAPFPRFGPEMQHTLAHAVTSAARETIRNALTKEASQMRLLEPHMQLVITLNKDNRQQLSNIMGDLSRRRSQVTGLNDSTSNPSYSGNSVVEINALVPLSEILGYSTFLRQLTSGQADLHMSFSHYEMMDPIEQEKLVYATKYGI